MSDKTIIVSSYADGREIYRRGDIRKVQGITEELHDNYTLYI